MVQRAYAENATSFVRKWWKYHYGPGDKTILSTVRI